MAIDGNWIIADASTYPGIAWASEAVKAGTWAIKPLARKIGQSTNKWLSLAVRGEAVPERTLDKIDERLRPLMLAAAQAPADGGADAPVVVEHGPEDLASSPIDWWRDRGMSLMGWSSSDLAREVGVDASTISRVLKGNYKGDAERIEEMLEAARMRALGPSLGVRVRTIAEKAITEALSDSVGSPFLTVIYGDSGIGKTEALRRWLMDGRANSLLLTIDQNATTLTVLIELADRLGVSCTGQASVLVNRIVEALRRDSRLLIFDEFNNIARYPEKAGKLLNTLRQINDETLCGVVICGTLGVHHVVYAPRNRNEMEMVISRIGREVHLPTPREAEIRAFVTAHFPAMTSQAMDEFFTGLNGNRRDQLHTATHNSFRRAACFVISMRKIMRSSGCDPTPTAVRGAWGRMRERMA